MLHNQTHSIVTYKFIAKNSIRSYQALRKLYRIFRNKFVLQWNKPLRHKHI